MWILVLSRWSAVDISARHKMQLERNHTVASHLHSSSVFVQFFGISRSGLFIWSEHGHSELTLRSARLHSLTAPAHSEAQSARFARRAKPFCCVARILLTAESWLQDRELAELSIDQYLSNSISSPRRGPYHQHSRKG